MKYNKEEKTGEKGEEKMKHEENRKKRRMKHEKTKNTKRETNE